MRDPRTPFKDGADLVDPRQLLEALADARDVMSYSNYHCDKFSRAEAVIRAYCRQHNFPIGPTQAAREKKLQLAHERDIRAMRAGGKRALAVLKRHTR